MAGLCGRERHNGRIVRAKPGCRTTGSLSRPVYDNQHMCGRYTLRTKLNVLLSQFAAELAEAWPESTSRATTSPRRRTCRPCD